jgi:hypothetical protein
MQSQQLHRLIEMFDDHPAYPPLEARMAGSRWIEVREREDSAYLLGLLFDSTPAPTHLVYGVKGTRDRPFAPQAEWLSATDDDGNEGYWLVYHNITY